MSMCRRVLFDSQALSEQDYFPKTPQCFNSHSSVGREVGILASGTKTFRRISKFTLKRLAARRRAQARGGKLSSSKTSTPNSALLKNHPA
jgi:hypothetical protein